MDTYIVATVTTNKKPTDPPAITLLAVRAPSEADAIQMVNSQVIAPQWATEARSLRDGNGNVLGLNSGEIRQL